MQELGDPIPYVCTINEANIAIGIANAMKSWSASSAQVGLNVDMAARMKAYYAELGQAFGIPPQ